MSSKIMYGKIEWLAEAIYKGIKELPTERFAHDMTVKGSYAVYLRLYDVFHVGTYLFDEPSSQFVINFELARLGVKEIRDVAYYLKKGTRIRKVPDRFIDDIHDYIAELVSRDVHPNPEAALQLIQGRIEYHKKELNSAIARFDDFKLENRDIVTKHEELSKNVASIQSEIGSLEQRKRTVEKHSFNRFKSLGEVKDQSK